MGLRFWKRLRLLPGVTLNLSRHSKSISVGPRGAKLTFGPYGVHATLGLPGTGLFYTHQLTKASPFSQKASPKPTSTLAKASPATVLFEAALDHLEAGDEAQALATLEARPAAVRHADISFLAGLLHLRAGNAEVAATELAHAAGAKDLGTLFGEGDAQLDLQLDITDDVVVVIRPDTKGATLAWVEALQLLERTDEARRILEAALAREPLDALLKVSLEDLDET